MFSNPDDRKSAALVAFAAVTMLLACAAFTTSSCASKGTSGQALVGPPPGSVPTTYTPPAPADFSKLGWTAAFDKLQAKFSREYAFTGWKHIDWKALQAEYRPRIAAAEKAGDKKAYYLALREYVHEMRDGHVGIDPEDMTVLAQDAGGGFGMTIEQLDDGTIVASWVATEGPAASAGIEPGARIVAWDGKPAATALRETSTVLAASQATTERTELEQLRFMVRAPVGAAKEVEYQNPGSSAPKAATLKAVDDQGDTLTRTESRSIFANAAFPTKMVEQRSSPATSATCACTRRSTCPSRCRATTHPRCSCGATPSTASSIARSGA